MYKATVRNPGREAMKVFKEIEHANKRHANRDRQLALLDILTLVVQDRQGRIFQ